MFKRTLIAIPRIFTICNNTVKICICDANSVFLLDERTFDFELFPFGHYFKFAINLRDLVYSRYKVVRL
jgi:hypothetical protein